MLGERVFGRPKSRAERVRSRKSRRTNKVPKDLALDRGERRQSARSRRGTYGTAFSARGRSCQELHIRFLPWDPDGYRLSH